MSSSSDQSVLRGASAGACTPLALDRDLAGGRWTRLGTPDVRGDVGVEASMDQLADQVHAAARAQGYAAGWAQGRREAALEVRTDTERSRAEARGAQEQAASYVERLLSALDVTVQEVRATAAVDRELVEQRLSAVVLDLVEAVIGSELSDGRVAATTALTRALRAAPRDGAVTVHLNPSDLTTLEVLAVDVPTRVSLVADADVAPGDAIVEGDHCWVNASVSEAIARITSVLTT